ncbi:MAG: aldose epimerase family protein, partial [Oscillospiraceae bacterium]
MQITHKKFGETKHGKEVLLYTLTNKKGEYVQISTLGATIVSLFVKDNKDTLIDVVLGYDSVEKYEKNRSYVGAIVGRCANRILGSAFKIGEKTHMLYSNLPNDVHLHGGKSGFNQKIWSGEVTQNTLQLSYLSVDGEEGYPANLKVCVSYEFTDDSELILFYHATTDADTIVNLTNHAYFNLCGADNDYDILSHTLQINAQQVTKVCDGTSKLGAFIEIANTPLDFVKPKQIRLALDTKDPLITSVGGLDHNYSITNCGDSLALASVLNEPLTGIEMKTYTTKPGIQVYTANYLKDDFCGKYGITYGPYFGVCMETQ